LDRGAAKSMTGRIYLDHAATTPVRDEVLAAMLPYFGEAGFNASSLHAEGRRARAGLDGARARVAGLLGAKPREIVFTGGGSESDNLAILGAARARDARHIVSASTEHHAVLHALDVLRAEGREVTLLPVDSDGRISLDEFRAALRADTGLVTLMLANNELGTVHPIAELAALARQRGILFHTDAVQAPGRLRLDVAELGVDLLTLSAHKFYGPKGAGVLYVREGTPLVPLVVGGGQEAGLRAGTENVAGIVGLSTALELAVRELPVEAPRLAALRDRFEEAILREVPDSRINSAGASRLPNLSSVAFDGLPSPEVLARLDLEGIAVSAGSACAAGAVEASHVLLAIGAPTWVANGTIRFSFGRLTGEEETSDLCRRLPGILEKMREPARFLGTNAVGLTRGRSEVGRW
jgi:cysteine desulfurase